MGLSRLLYVSLHFFVTLLHNFHVILSELYERLFPVSCSPQSALNPNIQVANNNNFPEEDVLLEKAGSELKQLKKLPSHVACVFPEPELDLGKIVSVVRWCQAAGVNCISLYDHKGIIVSQRKALEAALDVARTDRVLRVHQGFIQQESSSTDSTDVFLLSGSDGRPLLAKMARELARSSSSELDQAGVELMMDRLHPKEPELLLQFSGSRILSNSTMGYPPWHLRLTQMMRVPSHKRVRAHHIASAMLSYGSCQQRYGK